MASEKVILAMSGGVDSSVAAGLLIEQGYEVIGVFMCLGVGPEPSDACDIEDGAKGGCCSPEAAEDARRVAGALGIAFHVVDFAAEFERILDYFAAEYGRGRTPNPCARCNEWLKFGKLFHYAAAAGAKYVATGHHARIAVAHGRPAVFRALDRAKDQSYVLFGIPADTLGRVLLPIGEIVDKGRVRAMARELDLRVADKPDSQDICFVTDGKYTDLLAERAPQSLRPGPIVDADGRVVGEHQGVGHFTIGQRKGLGVAASEPMYVTGIDADAATVIIGPRAAACSMHLSAVDANWHAPVGTEPFRSLVQIRYGHTAQPAMVRPDGADRFTVTFDEPIHAITPGQIAAVYDDDRLLGGGWIESSASREPK